MMITAVSASWFVRVGSRAEKPSRTIHAMRTVNYTDKRGNVHGTAFCGAMVGSMTFDSQSVSENFCERCRKSGRPSGYAATLQDSV